MNNPLPGTAKFSTQMCQRKQTDGVTVVVKNTVEDFEAAKTSSKCKNRLETKHFKTISVCVAPNGVYRRDTLVKGVRIMLTSPLQLFHKCSLGDSVILAAYAVIPKTAKQAAEN